MQKKTIIVDVDDVLATFTRDFVAYANKNWGSNVKFEDYTENWGEMFGVGLDEWGQRALELYENGLFEELSLVDGAKEGLEFLHKNYKLKVLTSRHSMAKDLTTKWLKEKLGDVIDEVNFAGFYEDMDEHAHKKNKGELCRVLDGDYLIDDQPKHCNGAVECGIKAVLFGDYKWNNEAKVMPGVVRAKNWREVVEYFEGEIEQ